jgi:hypothetical protein
MAEWMRDKLDSKQDQVFEKVFYDFQPGFTNRLLAGVEYADLRAFARQYAGALSGVYADPEKAVDALIEEALGEPAADLDAYFNQ